MSVYALTGTLGNGKTIMSVDQIRDRLKRGCRVATNLDLRLENLISKKNKTASVVRLPDRPTAINLNDLGLGCDKLDSKNFGLIVLDELATWLNSRTWNEKGRADLVAWLVHSRKRRWDVIFLIQDIDGLDKQVKQMLVEYHVPVVNLEKIRIPIISFLGRVLTAGAWDGFMPRVHIGYVTYVPLSTPSKRMIVQKWILRGTDLYEAYDTEQVISDSYDCGSFSYLPPWQVAGRYLPLSGWDKFVHDCRVTVGLAHPIKTSRTVAVKLRPLMALSPDTRWLAARHLVRLGLI